MEATEKALISGFMGTNLMTAFSYLAAELAKENFSEPRHLSVMLKRLAPGIPKSWQRVAGWGAHYAVGILFVLVYKEMWESGKLKPSISSALILGTLSGAIAILIWKATFKAHPLPPWINYRNYYLQLLPAHIVFAVVSTITYRLLSHREIVNYEELYR